MNSLLNKYLFYYPAIISKTSHFFHNLKEMKKSQWYSTNHLQEIQLKKLIDHLCFAKSNIPYYSKALKSIEPRSFQSIGDLQKIPILTKELLKQNFDDLLYANLKGTLRKTTGGSTGNPVTIYKSSKAVGAMYAAEWRGYEWAGVEIGDRQVRFWGTPHSREDIILAKLKDFVANRLRCSAFSFDEENLQKYYKVINDFKPQYFYGYVSMIEAFSKYLLKHNIKLDFQLKCVISTSEVLTPTHRKLFENAFNCKVYNEYGCGELGTIAHECENGSLHISSENMIVEIINDHKICKCGETGDIVVTELDNRAMPLIRYNLRDLGFIHNNCSCGRGLPILGGITGRAYDTIYNREGKAFHGEYFMYIFEELQNQDVHVSSFQVNQLDYENFIIKLVMDERLRKELENYIYKRVHATYGPYAKIKFEYVLNIEREKSGKMRLIKTLLPR
jgi:phenylacetate-CoA ligase